MLRRRLSGQSWPGLTPEIQIQVLARAVTGNAVAGVLQVMLLNSVGFGDQR
jgi:hypothetical protein